ncbi:hypothetical protein [Larkinella sp. C7]|uniref:hypothetical protein n=1 Tax=Larkinella sp. C7 TaxID=2576607 RepID=UPI0011114DA4|nr:hypothetical protein [Larkinella sp. C7]
MMLKDTEEPSPLSNFVTDQFIALPLLPSLALGLFLFGFNEDDCFFWGSLFRKPPLYPQNIIWKKFRNG